MPFPMDWLDSPVGCVSVSITQEYSSIKWYEHTAVEILIIQQQQHDLPHSASNSLLPFPTSSSVMTSHARFDRICLRIYYAIQSYSVQKQERKNPKKLCDSLFVYTWRNILLQWNTAILSRIYRHLSSASWFIWDLYFRSVKRFFVVHFNLLLFVEEKLFNCCFESFVKFLKKKDLRILEIVISSDILVGIKCNYNVFSSICWIKWR